MKLILNLIKKTQFWAENYLVLKELRYLSGIALLAIVLTLMSALMEGFGLGFLVAFLRILTEPDAQPLKTGIHWFDISVLGLNLTSTERFYRISWIILLTTWIKVFINYFSSIITEITQLKLLDRFRRQVFEQLTSFQLSFFAKSRVGELINTLTNETERLKTAFGAYSAFLSIGLTCIVYIISLLVISWQLTIAVLVLLYMFSIGLQTFYKFVRERSFATTKANGLFTSIAIEFISGIRTVHAFATQKFERRRFFDASYGILKTNIHLNIVANMIKPLSDGFAVTVLVGLIIFAFGFISKGTIFVSSLLAFFFILFRLIPLLQALNGVILQINSLSGSITNINNFLRRDDKPYFKDGFNDFFRLKKSIEFISVDFGYNPDNLILKDINLTVKEGEMTALVGSSGAGKTTLVDLIARFIDPVKGQILFDGVDSRDFKVETLRKKMAIVSQDTFVFNTSILNNISYGSEGCSIDQVVEAAQFANALEFIQEMPEKFETILGDRGVRLSGGQRQRIAIARALLHNPEILILDEATSALDSISERLIQEALEKLSVGRTVITIAHRLSTIARADKVIVVEQGRIVEQGRYQDLLDQRGKLWNYHKIQHNFDSV
jgi:ATP-binding cassette, subfamily B, bacterial MsbA